MRQFWKAMCAVVSVAAMAAACGGEPSIPGSSPGDEPGAQVGTTQAGARMGRLTVNLVDAPKPEIQSIFVTLEAVEAYAADGTVHPVLDSAVTVDLLTLQNGNFLPLGDAVLPPGELSQLRLKVAEGAKNYVVLADGSTASLEIPSGETSGIKVNGPFHVAECGDTTVTLDFDGEKSVHAHQTGNGRFILRPVIFVKQIEESAAECPEPADAGVENDGGADEVDGGTADFDAGTPGDAGASDEESDAGEEIPVEVP